MSAKEATRLRRTVANALRALLRERVVRLPMDSPAVVEAVVAGLQRANLDGARGLGRRRWEGVSDEDAHAARSKGGKSGGVSAWASMSAQERSDEMRRRAVVRSENARAEEED